jgi:hypothetical protein
MIASQVNVVKSILDFIDALKYRPTELWRIVSAPTPESTRIREWLQSESEKHDDWPSEFRSWEPCVLGLVASQIATIASPYVRHEASQELFLLAEHHGYSRAKILMLCGEMFDLEAVARSTSVAPDELPA